MQIPFPEEILRAAAGHGDTKDLIDAIAKGYLVIVTTLKGGGTVFACGNGGSAADSMHFAAELTGRYKKERVPLRAVALGTNISEITAIGNDYGFEHVFERPLQALARTGDCVVAFTTSGKSPNVIRALRYAKEKGLGTVVLTGASPAPVNVDVSIQIPSSLTPRIQEIHERIHHHWCENLDEEKW